MKLAGPILLALSALVVGSPALNPASGSELLTRAPGCQDCKDRFDFCFNNGRTKGQEGCAQTCAEHVCWQTPQCRGCRGPFDKCPEKSRYHHACGDKLCDDL